MTQNRKGEIDGKNIFTHPYEYSKVGNWTCYIEMMNCGSRTCKQGCVDPTGTPIRDVCPHGPYRLMSRCIGGKQQRIRMGTLPVEEYLYFINLAELPLDLTTAQYRNRFEVIMAEAMDSNAVVV